MFPVGIDAREVNKYEGESYEFIASKQLETIICENPPRNGGVFGLEVLSAGAEFISRGSTSLVESVLSK